ncbi:MAG: gliding motility-associated C-terminal domain-containing protein [Bacteroidota bacterium]
MAEMPLYGSPQEISGVINNYARVNTIASQDAVILDEVGGFSDGDTVLVMQMKGVSVQVTQSTGFGSAVQYVGEPGYYEFVIIDQVEPGPKRITFRSNLIGYSDYDTGSFVQLIRVPSYESATVTGELSCAPWDSISGTGGVLALIVNKKLTLNADIDVTGKGYKGGPAATLDGTPLDDDLFYRPESSDIAGRKGEGMASHVTNFITPLYLDTIAKGKGALYTGGGGAVGEYSGGGGGAGFGEGGNGYWQRSGGFFSGLGGWDVDDAYFSDRVIMGGGGGGSGYDNAVSTGTGGAPGGGIVFLLTDSLAGNGHAIMANGDSLTTIAEGNAGAGGGGGAGSLVLSVKSFASSDITLEARGGTGGHTRETFGAGGGGGGGLVWLSGSGMPAEADVDVSGGHGGKRNYPTGSVSGSDGKAGTIRSDLKMLLNGFLFNSIISSFTGTQTDSICYGMKPQMIAGTEPVGGVEPYTFRWEKKGDDESAWSLVSESETLQNLVPDVPETDTLQFRRVVTDSNTSPVSDTSKAVSIIVQPLITGNLVGYDTIICAGQDPQLLLPAGAGPGGGNNNYFYRWIDSTATDSWQFAPGTGTNSDYDPPALTATTYYSRVVISGRCIDTSNVTTVEVLPVISNNDIAEDQLICYDMLFDDLTGSDPSDGDGSYTFEWISSSDQNNWSTAGGTADTRDYDPDETLTYFPGERYYRRVVKSGHLDCCIDSSAQVKLTSLPVISNNTVSADNTVCQDSVPATLTGSTPGGGDGSNYTYIWEDSTRSLSWSVIAGAEDRDYQPPALADTTWYRRIILSSACDDTSNVVVVNVNPSILDNTISTLSGAADTIICYGQTPLQLKGEIPSGGDGSYAYEWQHSEDGQSWSTAPGSSDQPAYNPPSLTDTTWYRRIVLSGACETVSNEIKITVLPLITGNSISPDQMICYNTQPALIEGSEPEGGDGSYTYLWEQSDDNMTWTAAAETNNEKDYQPGVLTDKTWYRRIVLSGFADCCGDTSNVAETGIYPLPTGTITAAQDTSCAGSSITVSMSLTGAAPWTVTLNDGSADLPSFTAGTANYDFTHAPEYTSDYTFVSIVDDNSCVATSMSGSRSVVVYEVPVADAGMDDDACGPVYDLQASPSAGNGLWSNSEGAIDNIADASSPATEVTVGSYGDHTFWWKETNWQCIDSASVTITFWEEPEPADAGRDTTLKPYQTEYTLDAAEPTAGTGTWTLIESQGNPTFSNENDALATVYDLLHGDNIFEWTIVNGICSTSDRVKLYVPMVFIPNGFSPGGNDAINDVFEIRGIENTDNTLVITNMAGAVVYRTGNYRNDWRGTGMDGRDLPEGTYYYFLTIKSPVNETYSGYVVIKR